MPRAMTPVSRSSETTPLPRIRNQTALPLAKTLIAPAPASRRRARPRRRGRPGARGARRPRATAGPTRPRTIAAVPAMLASTQVAAATLTVRHTSSAGSARRGSRMWWRGPAPDSPPADRGAGGREAALAQADGLALAVEVAVVVGHPHRPSSARRLTAQRDVPAEADEGPGAGRLVDGAGGPVGGERLRGGPEVDPDTPGDRDGAARRGPAADRAPSRHRGDPHADPGAAAATIEKSRSYPSSSIARPTVGSTSPSVMAAARRATSRASTSSGLTATPSPAARFTAVSSESSRNRLQARSMRSAHGAEQPRPPRAPRARPPPPGRSYRGR